LFCIITALYIPILSGAVLIIPVTTITTRPTAIVNNTAIIIFSLLHGAILIFTGLRIRAALRRQTVKIRYYQNTPETSMNLDDKQPATKRATTLGTRRTLKIVAFTSAAFFLFCVTCLRFLPVLVAVRVYNSSADVFQIVQATCRRGVHSNVACKHQQRSQRVHLLIN